ncbi:MAG: PKD domain-containing protein [Clostridia bacterium]|nr:PKD domain-containing protein [Clostridia bacterium]
MAENQRTSVLLTAMAILLILAFFTGGSALAKGAPAGLHGGWQPGPGEYHPNRVIVRFSSEVRTDSISATAAGATIERLGYTIRRVTSFSPSFESPEGVTIGVVELPSGVTPDAAVAELSRMPGVLYAERDYKVYVDQVPVIPNDTRFAEMWGLHNENLPPAYKDPEMSGSPVNDADIDAPEAWEQHTGSGDVVVAIIDTGAYIHHPDLAPNIWVNPGEIPGNGVDDDHNGYVDDVNGWDYFNGDNSVFDPNERDSNGYLNDEHGTHTSGTIGAVSNNAMGVAGINWNVKVIVLKFIGPDGGYTSDAILALQYAAGKGAVLASCSWGGGGYEQALKDAIEASGMLVVCAAGNSGANTDVSPHYPSSYDSSNIISVAASMQNDEPCSYPDWWSTCWGPVSVDLFAPGGYILSTVPPDPVPPTPTENYAFFYGTSMATPHVSGAAALVHARYPEMPLYPGAAGWSPGMPNVKDTILGTVDVKPAFQGKVLTGGRLNAAAALTAGGAPVITSATADPTYGPPPLQVAFTASAMAPTGQIVDVWWEFGDGSSPVHEYNVDHTYTDQGSYDASFHVLNDSGIESIAVIRIQVFFPPVIGVDPTSLQCSLRWGEQDARFVTITNSGLGDLNYTAAVRLLGRVEQTAAGAKIGKLGSGGPDQYGYFWMDSDEPGVGEPEWNDISAVGTEITLSDDGSQLVDLPFTFPFYGQPKTQVRICSNGYLTFGASGSSWSNAAIPSSAAPNDLLAVFWDDLNPSAGGHVYYLADDEGFIVQWDSIPRLGSGGPYTFQAILAPQGGIIYQYKTMAGSRLNEATIGIENSTGSDGLQAAYNQPYVHDDLAVVFIPGWAMLFPTEGTVAPGDTADLEVLFFADHLPEGDYAADVVIESNDPERPEVTVDTLLHVESVIPPVISSLAAQPWAGKAPLTVEFAAQASDSDGHIAEIEWDYGDGSAHAMGTLTATHVYENDGEYDAVLTITDDDGLTDAESVHIVVRDLPKASVEPPAIASAVRAHRSRQEKLTVTNTGDAALVFTATAVTSSVPEIFRKPVEPTEMWEAGGKDDVDPRPSGAFPTGAGGPDAFGYMWKDSDAAGGPVFDWVEISGVGTQLSGLTDDEYVDVALPWAFPFYGQTRTSVKVNANGHLTFGATGSMPYSNDPIPNPRLPNDLMAVYWDDLRPAGAPAGGGVFQYYDAANDRFIVEYNQAPRYYTNGSYTFQVILYPNGTIIYQYLDMTFSSASYAKDGTVGIENGAGDDGLQILYNTAGYMKNGLAIKIWPFAWLSLDPAGGTIAPGASMELDVVVDLTPVQSGSLEGAVVLETNDVRKPVTVVPVQVNVIPNQSPVITACGVNPPQGPVTMNFQFVAAAGDPDGAIAHKYWTFGDGAPAVHEFVAEHTYASDGLYTATFTAVDNDGYVVTADVKVRVEQPPAASWTPSQFRLTMAQGQIAERTLTLSNAGPGRLAFGSEAPANSVHMPERLAYSGAADHCRITASGLYKPNENCERSPWLPSAVGTVIASWTSPAPVTLTWGVGANWDTSDVIIGDPDALKDVVVTADGAYAGKIWDTSFGGSWAADMAFTGESVWQVNVGGDNGIYKLNPDTGAVLGSITTGAWAGTSQRGLAYNSNDDTFYIGGWNEDIIYHIKGETWADPGGVIDQWSMPVAIAGLAYHPMANILAVTNNGEPDMVYFVDPVSHSVVAQFPHPAGLTYSGAGCEFDSEGNLWIASQGNNTMYLVETDLGPTLARWLTWSPRNGTVAAGGSEQITVAVNSERLSPGSHSGAIVLYTNDTEYPMIMVPVDVNVARPPVITEASAMPLIGEPPLQVAFHAAYSAPETQVASYGWDFGDGSSSTALDAVHTYTAAGAYTAVFTVTDALGAQAKASFAIDVRPLPHAEVEPTSIELTLAANATASRTVAVKNSAGNAPLTFSAKVKGGPAPLIAMPKRVGFASMTSATSAEGLYDPLSTEVVERIAASVRPNAIGDVIASWPAPASIDNPWGVGFDGANVWIADPSPKKDHVVTPAGAHTGTIFATPWAGSWPGDMAYDAARNLVWQVNVGGDNGIYGLNAATGAVMMSITSGGSWTSVSQRGLAYNAGDDTFYIGGWNQDIIYHVKGPSWDIPGAVIEQWAFPVGIAGLAWHPNGVLFVSNNGSPDMIYAIDVASRAVIAQFPHPAGLNYSGAGMELDTDGNLWVTSQDNKYVYLVNTEMPIARGITVDPTSGTVGAGAVCELAVTFVGSEIGMPGDDVHKHIEITTNDPFNAALNVDLLIHIQAGPSITGVTAAPQIGQPPLSVSFDATVTPGAVPVVDVWWEFGDGSDPVHNAHAEHVYSSIGEYEARVHAVDENGVEASIKTAISVKWLPTLGVEPLSFNEVIAAGSEIQTNLNVSNTGAAPMNFTVGVAPSFAQSPEWKQYASAAHSKGEYALEPRGYAGAGAGGPDQFGYVWMDSNQEHGPVYEWIEIESLGTRVPLTDESGVSVPLPFRFPFYGQAKTTVNIASNGYLTFDSASIRGFYINGPIPDGAKPNDMIAAFWDDLDPGTAGANVFYYYDEPGRRFIVEFQSVPQWGSSSGMTFQVILRPDGTIVCQYLDMPGDVSSATLGIENAIGDDGLQVAYNASYIEDGLAVAFAPVGSVISVNPTSGRLLAGGRQDVVVTLGSPAAAPGTYSLYIYVSADDPYRPFAAIPVALKLNLPPAVTISAPAAGEEWRGTKEIMWTAADPDDAADDLAIDIYWARDAENWRELAADIANTGSHPWDTWTVGAGGDSFRVRVVATDPAGESNEGIAGPFTIVNDPPVAAFSFAPSPAKVTDEVEFADESTDDGEIATWLWKFGDGVSSSEKSPKHKYTAKGKFTVELTVADNGGLTGTIQHEITVINTAPTVKIGKPEAGAVWTGVRFIEYEASDPDGDELTMTFEYDYLADNFGWAMIAAGQENTGKYEWDTSKVDKGGLYRVRVTAFDTENESAQTTSEQFTIVVLSRPVIAAPNPAESYVTFYYSIASAGQLYVYDIAGRLVHKAALPSTANSYTWGLASSDGRPLAYGLYLYVVVTESGEKSEVGRLVVSHGQSGPGPM